MNPQKLVPLLAKLFELGERPLLIGSPGSAKTSCVKAAAREADFDLLIMHPVTDDPVDWKGIPYVGGHNKVAEFLPAGSLRRLVDVKKPTVAFLDDLGQAPPAVQAATMQPVLGGEINGHIIPDDVVWCAASNRREDKAGVSGLITPLLNRFSPLLNVEVDEDSWCEWALQNDMPHDLVSYIRFKPDLLGKFAADSGRDMKATTTPRSLAALGRLVNAGIEDPETLSGAAGEGVAAEYLAHRRIAQGLPRAEDIFAAPTKAKVPPRDKPDVLYALMGALAFKVRKGTFTKLTTDLERTPIEFAVLCVKDALNRDKQLKSSNAFVKWALKNKEAFGYE